MNYRKELLRIRSVINTSLKILKDEDMNEMTKSSLNEAFKFDIFKPLKNQEKNFNSKTLESDIKKSLSVEVTPNEMDDLIAHQNDYLKKVATAYKNKIEILKTEKQDDIDLVLALDLVGVLFATTLFRGDPKTLIKVAILHIMIHMTFRGYKGVLGFKDMVLNIFKELYQEIENAFEKKGMIIGITKIIMSPINFFIRLIDKSHEVGFYQLDATSTILSSAMLMIIAGIELMNSKKWR